MICSWICLLNDIYTLLDEDTIELSESEENSQATTTTGASLSTRQSSIRSQKNNAIKAQAAPIPTIVYEETKEPPTDLSETIKNIP